jgi:hypothetical protein
VETDLAQDITIPVPAEHEILLSIRNERPLQAAILGELLSALSRDYRQMNRGRGLAVTRIETGSVFIFLTDAFLAAKPYLDTSIEVVKGAKAIFDFAKSIRDFIGKKKNPNSDLEQGVKQGPYRSIEKMIKIAAETGSELQIRYSDGNGGSFEASLAPLEAVAIRKRTGHPELQAKVMHQERERLLEEATSALIKGVADEQLALPGSRAHHPLIGTVVRLLRQTRNGHLVEMLASELQGRGYSELAAAVRAEASNDVGERPPIT